MAESAAADCIILDCAIMIGQTILVSGFWAQSIFVTARSSMRATKWALLIALAFVAISCNAEQANSDVLIKDDGGGDIYQYIAKYLSLQWSGERVVIDGECLSACTLALGLLSKQQRCFTNNARLGFHAAYTDSGKAQVGNPIGTDIFWLSYPAKIRRWISKHGGLTSKVIYLEGKELAAMYPPCKASSKKPGPND